MNKPYQKWMIWLLPVVAIGGLFNAYLGYLMLAMMVVMIPLAVFKGRLWCWNLCPRGAFLDLVMVKVSGKKPTPRLFTKMWFRWLIFVIFMTVFALRIIKAGGNWLAIGGVFVSVCVITTIIAIIFALIMKHRGWCMICPMGTLQERLKIKR